MHDMPLDLSITSQLPYVLRYISYHILLTKSAVNDPALNFWTSFLCSYWNVAGTSECIRIPHQSSRRRRPPAAVSCRWAVKPTAHHRPLRPPSPDEWSVRL